MNTQKFLHKSFEAYYKEHIKGIPEVSLLTNREFGFIPWDKAIMIRHMGFNNSESFKKYLQRISPRHVYSSGTLYESPEFPQMERKGYIGCDFIIDIDVDHFYTPCKEDHDRWYCQECDATGKGMMNECDKCGSLKIKTLNWICDKCLEISKNEIIKLIDNFLVPDFNIPLEDMEIAFSGHRGYHLKIENERIRKLKSEERREISDYLTGKNINFEILGLRNTGSRIYGPVKNNYDWMGKIIREIIHMLETKSNTQIEDFLANIGFGKELRGSFLNSMDLYLNTLKSEEQNLWSIEGFGIKTWKLFLQSFIDTLAIRLDEPVSIDVHRLIRYPGSLHGKTGFIVRKMEISDLDEFNPLNETNQRLDPIAFYNTETTHNIEIIAEFVPQTFIKDEIYGPYNKGENHEVPHHIAIFLLSKGVAKIL